AIGRHAIDIAMPQAHAYRARAPGDACDSLELGNGLTAGRAIRAHTFTLRLGQILQGRDVEVVDMGPRRADFEVAAAFHAEARVPSIARLQVDARSFQFADVRLQDVERVRDRNGARGRIAMDRLTVIAAE